MTTTKKKDQWHENHKPVQLALITYDRISQYGKRMESFSEIITRICDEAGVPMPVEK